MSWLVSKINQQDFQSFFFLDRFSRVLRYNVPNLLNFSNAMVTIAVMKFKATLNLRTSNSCFSCWQMLEREAQCNISRNVISNRHGTKMIRNRNRWENSVTANMAVSTTLQPTANLLTVQIHLKVTAQKLHFHFCA